MPPGEYTFISLHVHTLRREFFQEDFYSDIAVSSLVPLKSIIDYGLAAELDFAGYGKEPIEVFESYDDIPEILPRGKFLVILADTPMGRYWIPVIAVPSGSTSRHEGGFCLHFP
jgi:hypothetical protein